MRGWTTMALGGGDGSDGLLIGPIMEWWDKHTAKRDAKRTAKLEAKAAKRASSSSDSRAPDDPAPR